MHFEVHQNVIDDLEARIEPPSTWAGTLADVGGWSTAKTAIVVGGGFAPVLIAAKGQPGWTSLGALGVAGVVALTGIYFTVRLRRLADRETSHLMGSLTLYENPRGENK